MTALVRVMLATNDHRNGADTGMVSAIHFDWGGYAFLNLESTYGPPEPVCVCRVIGRVLWLGRRRYPILDHEDWVGNWCWREVTVPPVVADWIVKYLLTMVTTAGNRKWLAESGTEQEFDRWESGAWESPLPETAGRLSLAAGRTGPQEAAQ